MTLQENKAYRKQTRRASPDTTNVLVGVRVCNNTPDDDDDNDDDTDDGKDKDDDNTDEDDDEDTLQLFVVE